MLKFLDSERGQACDVSPLGEITHYFLKLRNIAPSNALQAITIKCDYSDILSVNNSQVGDEICNIFRGSTKDLCRLQ